MKRGIRIYGALWACFLLVASGHAWAVTPTPTPPAPTGNFNLQVSPSPLVTTVTPGQKSSADLKIRNAGTGTEEPQIAPRVFTFNSDTGKVNLSDTTPPPIASWINFSAAKFTVLSGQTFVDTVSLNVPKDAGFSYSFALVITRQNNPKPQNGTREINGSVAIFTLINVNRPGATSQIKVVKFSADHHLYEYLPATISVRFSNPGNTIVQPFGNIFIQRNSSSKKAMATLPVNSTQGYILPGTQRTVTAEWNDGFATYQAVTQPDGSVKNHLNVDWSKLKHFRIGEYTAKLVAVYSDGQHDVPIEGTVTFWVIPWRAILLLIVVIVLLWLFFRWRGKRRTDKAVKRALAAQTAAQSAKKPKAEDKA